MKKLFLATAALTLLFSCGKKFETTENGVKYKILSHDENAKPIGKGDLVLVNLILKTEHDSLILETFSKNSPRYIPFEEPVLTQVFSALSKGDSLEILVNADTLFMKSFGMPKPANIKSGENIHFTMKVVESLDQKEILKKRADQQNELSKKDSLALNDFIKTLKDVKQTASGLRYVIEKSNSGKQPKSGDKITVKYKGMLLNGEVFDATKEGAEPFQFTVGLGQVIKGWDEGLLLMHEGEKFKFIIPSNLAYGEGGSGPIPPLSTLIFDVELVKVN
jgi:FKBP-type peptidyl-prolyl cis-trans isomerase